MELICGINPVLEALSAGSRHFDRLLIVKGIRNRRIAEAIGRASRLGVPLRFEARETLDRMAGEVSHQGIIAVVSAKPVMALEELLDAARSPALIVLLDGVQDPRNLGAILRSAEAAGADGVLLPERHSVGLSETVARASAGGLEHVKVARVGNVSHCLETLKARGLWIVGYDAAGTERWDRVDLCGPVALVLGGEGRGIRRLVRERCDHLASFPLFGHVSSLNVSVAAGIALYEAIRQRGTVPSHVRPIPPRPAPAKQVVGPGPDDREGDPGRVPGFVAGEADTLADEDPVSLVRIGDEEEWSAPAVLRASGASRGAWPRGRRWRRERGERATPPGRESGAERAPAGEPAGGAPRPRRRRGRGPARRPAPGSAPGTAGSVPPPAEGGGSGQAPRRRRRRRRG